jgi:hypothetical protein
MTLTTSAASVRIAREIREAEAKFDDALLATSKLMATMILTRQTSDIGVNTGQKAIIRLVRAQQHIVDGTSDMFRVHDELVAVSRELGIMDEDELTTGSGLTDLDVARAA